MPAENTSLSDQNRILIDLESLCNEPVIILLTVLRTLYPMCREADFDITVTQIYREIQWVLVNAEPGDQTQYHSGLAVDYGSATIIMQLIDMMSCAVFKENKR